MIPADTPETGSITFFDSPAYAADPFFPTIRAQFVLPSVCGTECFARCGSKYVCVCKSESRKEPLR